MSTRIKVILIVLAIAAGTIGIDGPNWAVMLGAHQAPTPTLNVGSGWFAANH